MAKIVGFGALFGFVLSRAGATDYDAIRGMFLLRDLHLAGVMATAIALLAVSFALLRRRATRALNGQGLALASKPMTPRLVLGGLLFGAGWALSGTCPGTALAQLGEGRLAALATLAGILVSATTVEAWQSRAKQASPPGH
jgi:uncharacterized membrane protein YedE/YeeE